MTQLPASRPEHGVNFLVQFPRTDAPSLSIRLMKVLGAIGRTVVATRTACGNLEQSIAVGSLVVSYLNQGVSSMKRKLPVVAVIYALVGGVALAADTEKVTLNISGAY